jgi:hypothetical protein
VRLPEELIASFVVILVIAIVVEAVSTMMWAPWFYRSAPRLWRLVVSPVSLESPPELAIAEATNRAGWRPLVFQRLSGSEVAFRESLTSFRLGSGICGLIEEQASRHAVTITARCSWAIAIGLLWASIGTLVSHSAGPIAVAVILVVLLFAQRSRLHAMGRAIAPRQG